MPQKMEVHTKAACDTHANAVKDALYALNGKWKLLVIGALIEGPMRFKDIQRALGEITPKVLSKELKELELNELVTRTVVANTPVSVTYALTPYSQSLGPVINELRNWGIQHRAHIMKRTVPVQ